MTVIKDLTTLRAIKDLENKLIILKTDFENLSNVLKNIETEHNRVFKTRQAVVDRLTECKDILVKLKEEL